MKNTITPHGQLRPLFSLALLLVFALALTPNLQAQITATSLINVGALNNVSSAGSTATGINNSGQIVGFGNVAVFGSNHAYISTGTVGVLTDLGTLAGGDVNSFATGINASGQVVGYSQISNLNNLNHAFVSTSGTMTDLGALAGNNNSFGTGINNSGQVTGYSNSSSIQAGQRAFIGTVNSSGVVTVGLTSIGVVGTGSGGNFSQATGINASGQIVGTSSFASSGEGGFVFTSGVMTAIPSSGGFSAREANAINDSGQIVGQATNGVVNNAYLSTGGVMTIFGANNADAFGISASGQVVGSSGNHAFLVDNATFYDLNTLAASFLTGNNSTSGFSLLTTANAINDFGQIVGAGTFNDGLGHSFQRGFELNVAAVPEPATCAMLLGFGALGMVAWRRRRD